MVLIHCGATVSCYLSHVCRMQLCIMVKVEDAPRMGTHCANVMLWVIDQHRSFENKGTA